MKIKIKHWFTVQRSLALVGLLLLVVLALNKTVHAESVVPSVTPVVAAMGNFSLVSPQIYLAIIVFLAITALAVSLVYSAFSVHPTEQHLKRSRRHLLFAAAIIFITGVFGVYLILKL